MTGEYFIYERAKEIFKQKPSAGLDREIDEFFDAKFFGMIRPIEKRTRFFYLS